MWFMILVMTMSMKQLRKILENLLFASHVVKFYSDLEAGILPYIHTYIIKRFSLVVFVVVHDATHILIIWNSIFGSISVGM